MSLFSSPPSRLFFSACLPIVQITSIVGVQPQVAHACSRFLNSCLHYSDRHISLLLDILHSTPCEDRKNFFFSVRRCRRRNQAAIALGGEGEPHSHHLLGGSRGSSSSAVTQSLPHPYHRKPNVFELFSSSSDPALLQFRAIVGSRLRQKLKQRGMSASDAFRAFDVLHRGSLTAAELLNGLEWIGISLPPTRKKKSLVASQQKQEDEKFFKSIVPSLLFATSSSSSSSSLDPQEIFAYFDVDRDGLISEQDFLTVVGGGGDVGLAAGGGGGGDRGGGGGGEQGGGGGMSGRYQKDSAHLTQGKTEGDREGGGKGVVSSLYDGGNKNEKSLRSSSSGVPGSVTSLAVSGSSSSSAALTPEQIQGWNRLGVRPCEVSFTVYGKFKFRLQPHTTFRKIWEGSALVLSSSTRASDDHAVAAALSGPTGERRRSMSLRQHTHYKGEAEGGALEELREGSYDERKAPSPSYVKQSISIWAPDQLESKHRGIMRKNRERISLGYFLCHGTDIQKSISDGGGGGGGERTFSGCFSPPQVIEIIDSNASVMSESTDIPKFLDTFFPLPSRYRILWKGGGTAGGGGGGEILSSSSSSSSSLLSGSASKSGSSSHSLLLPNSSQLTLWIGIPPSSFFVCVGVCATTGSGVSPPPHALRCVPRKWIKSTMHSKPLLLVKDLADFFSLMPSKHLIAHTTKPMMTRQTSNPQGGGGEQGGEGGGIGGCSSRSRRRKECVALWSVGEMGLMGVTCEADDGEVEHKPFKRDSDVQKLYNPPGIPYTVTSLYQRERKIRFDQGSLYMCRFPVEYACIRLCMLPRGSLSINGGESRESERRCIRRWVWTDASTYVQAARVGEKKPPSPSARSSCHVWPSELACEFSKSTETNQRVARVCSSIR